MPSAAFRVVVEVDLAELPKAALRSPMSLAAVPGGGPAGLRRFNSSSLLQYSCLGSFEAAFAVGALRELPRGTGSHWAADSCPVMYITGKRATSVPQQIFFPGPKSAAPWS